MRKLTCVALMVLTTHANAYEFDATTKGLDLVDGAIVCPTYDLAEWLYGQINVARHYRKSLPPELIRQAMLVGEAPIEPRPSDFNCILVPEGTKVHVDMGFAPVITGRLRNGVRFQGVTLHYMVNRTPAPN